MTSIESSPSARSAGATEALADAVAAFDVARLPPAVLHEAKRALYNVLAVAVGATGHPGVDAILRVAREAGASGTAPVAGRAVRVDPHFSALANGFAGHVDDFDDTHLVTVIHPAASIAATLLALAPECSPSGAEAMRAFVLGCEVQLRVGVAISPEHYDDGWHITGTCGVIGAAVAAAALSGLDGATTARAIGLAASTTVGQREAFGTMAKAYHAGKAAANGIRAARLARAGFDAPVDALAFGFADALAHAHRIGALRTRLDAPFELAQNTYKPYPCGIVAHPSIDAAVALSARIGGAEIARVDVFCNPLVLDLMGNRTPADGLEARFSAVHGVTMGLRDGAVGLAQYADAIVGDPGVTALRAKVELHPTPEMPRDGARVAVTLVDGRVVEETVAHARGSLERPLTDDELGAKADALIRPVLGERWEQLRLAIRDLVDRPSLDALVGVVTP